MELGKQIGLSKSTVSRIEQGERVPTDAELHLILGALGVVGSAREALRKLAAEAHEPNWLATGGTGLPEQLTTLVDYESTATAITEVGLVVVPGLLQTREYCRAIYLSAGVPRNEIDTRVSTRLGRQRILTDTTPVEFNAVIDEAALRRPVGGSAAVADQLRHLLKMGERDNITVQVLPQSLGAHPGVDGSYVLMEFAAESPIVHLEQYRAGAFLDDREDVEAYRSLTDILRRDALSPAESAGLIRDCITEQESTG
ncbi:helix-turn-helix transcriptional regulator [Haloechinothrix sp. YIM 98757]|uniref:Helix-turn-helix transcriptional regulator n=1 Tax=Haloechinothrix aidingensis TaxID=2752311 RepID=A0A838AB48_9PSEU|nr:helix-turn-helix transcriptional regulator [Haloechinothrix aidingensis]